MTFLKPLRNEVGKYEFYPLQDGASGYNMRHTFTDGYAEYCVSTTSSCGALSSEWKGWKRWGVDNRKDGDLQFYLTTK